MLKKHFAPQLYDLILKIDILGFSNLFKNDIEKVKQLFEITSCTYVVNYFPKETKDLYT